jgi:hypothetical protein
LVILTGCAGGSGNSGSGGSAPNPTPLAITSVAPTDVPVGSPDVTVTVTGTGFSSGAQISVNSVPEATTFVSSTQVQATVPANQLTVGAVLSVSIASGGATAKADPSAVALTVDNPVPSLSAVSPNAVLLGSGSTTVTVTGTNFVSGVALSVNGTTRTSTFVSSTQFTAQLLASDFTSATSLPLNVINPKPGGGTSGTSSFTVDNPAPAVTLLAPSSALVGSSNTTVTLTGTGLLPSTVLQINGATQAATYVNGTQLTFALSAAQLASAGQLAITLLNPVPGGGASAPANFSVNNPAPLITATSPTTLLAGSDPTTVIVTGTGFSRGSTLQINGAAHAVTYVSATEIDVPLSATELASSGSLTMVVTNAQPGGGTSSAATVAVNNPTPSLVSLSPATIYPGSGNTAVTLTGSGFLPITTLQINGSAHAVSYSSSRQLILNLTAAEVAAPANDNLVLTNPAPAGGSSSLVTLAITTSTAPVITSLAPSSVLQGAAATNVTINGTGFLPTSTVQLFGVTRSGVVYVSSTQLTLPLSANDLLYSGTYGIIVTNPGGSSAPATFTVQAGTPVLTAITPSALAINSGSYTIVASGSNFSPSSVLLWNGTPLATTYYGNYQYPGNTWVYTLDAVVPQSLLTAAGSATITASTPTAASVSNALSVSITNPPVPSITSLSPGAVPVLGDAALSISGSGFATNSVVSYNGVPLTTTFNNSANLSVTIPASLLSVPGNGSLTVATPAPGGGTSTVSSLAVYVPLVSNDMVFNPVNGKAYLSIPSTAVNGNSIVSFDPATGALGTPIFVGSEPDAMAVSDDGTTLWVALDGTTAIRKVDLVAGVAGAEYSIAALGYYSYNTSVAATALLVLPGTTNSIAVTNGNTLGIFDSGVLRGSTVNVPSVYGLQVDATRSELYVGGYSNVQTYNYNSSGLTLRSAGNYNSSSITSQSFNEMQLSGGKIFTDFGHVYDSESGGLLGSLMNGTSTVSGPTFFDSPLSQIYVLTNASAYYFSGYSQVNLYNPSDYSNTGKSFAWNIPYSVTNSSGNTVYFSPHRLTRWGANGLLLHTKGALFTAQSNVVKDLSSVSADLSVSVIASGGTTTGSTATYTATVTNSGPQPATDVAIFVQAPSTGVITATSTTSGSCQALTGCDLGTLAVNASATITTTVLQTTAGNGTLSETVLSSSTDPNQSNNTASSSLAVTGTTYNLTPALTSISPNAVKVGTSTTTITVTGSNFAAGAQVMLGSTALSTQYVNSTQLTATVPVANLTAMGWSAVSVSNPAPGGGVSQSLPFTVFNVITIGLNHIAYEPFSRKLVAAVSSGSSSVTGSSIVTIDPTTGGFGTPITFATAPTSLSLSSSGKTAYAALAVPSSSSITAAPFGRVDLVHGTGVSTTVTLPFGYYGTLPIQTAAVQPGTEDVLAVAPTYSSLGIYDYNESTQTLSARPNVGGFNSSSCLVFLDANNLISTSYSTIDYPVTSVGLGSGVALNYPNTCFQLSGNTAATATGQFYTISSSASSQKGSVVLANSYGAGLPALDASLGSAFYPGNSSPTSSYGTVDGLISYNVNTFLRTGSIFLNIPAIEGNTYSTNITDTVRWGRDGLAMVTSSGHLYILSGPFVVPQELGANPAATLSSSSASTIAAGSDNMLLTLTGTNFLPGVAVTWNGSYRTTTVVDANHVTVAIPASDLTTAGSESLVATNPGGAASNALTIAVH